jgi:signal transduction histidine kinase
MEQVLLNLVVNARDAMLQGGQLTIEATNTDLDDRPERAPGEGPAGRYVMLAVADTGCGMSAEVRARLFQSPFTTKEPTKGTGLGLYTVHRIVKQVGGFIRVSSEPGKGARFELYLPRIDEARSMAP